MIEPSISPTEPARLTALRQTQLLDTPLEERFERITRLVCRLLGVPTASISMVDETRQWFKSIQGSSLTETPRKISFCGHAILDDNVMLVPDARIDVRFHDNPLVTGPDAVVFYAGHPLHASDGSRVGVLCAIDHKSREFSQEDLQILHDLAEMAEVEINASALVNTQKELMTQLDAERRRALIDPLTRLWNRDGILEILHREYQRALENNDQLGVLMADIDHFKRVNDAHGHPIGDVVLMDVAKRLLSGCREGDAVGRVGGEEFLLVLPIDADEASIEVIAARVCERVGESAVPTAAGPIQLTISVGGVQETVTDAGNIQELIAKADQALYRAKQLGRNRTEITMSVRTECGAP